MPDAASSRCSAPRIIVIASPADGIADWALREHMSKERLPAAVGQPMRARK